MTHKEIGPWTYTKLADKEISPWSYTNMTDKEIGPWTCIRPIK